QAQAHRVKERERHECHVNGDSGQHEDDPRQTAPRLVAGAAGNLLLLLDTYIHVLMPPVLATRAEHARWLRGMGACQGMPPSRRPDYWPQVWAGSNHWARPSCRASAASCGVISPLITAIAPFCISV